eukprot:TRINITY_DN17627_c0_g1_i1.p1 TRINITY_DN17627_c0_g1~~TRINITY_DN17627_c0_g1_i1.p1  ORF type:complete len:444 (+),score=-21.33 TRINITY_DN17627_c0_g1_i1:142-1473(+)
MSAYLSFLSQYDFDIKTRIYGNWYDLTEFTKNHPGGNLPLDLINKRDGTGLLKLHHPFSSKSVLLGMIEKYKLKNTEELNKLYDLPEEPFDYSESDFELELKKEVKNYFLNEFNLTEQTNIRNSKGVHLLNKLVKAPIERLMHIFILTLIFYVTVYYYVQGNWIALLFLPLIAWIYSVNFWHDATHFAMSTNEFVNTSFMYLTPFFSSPLSWFHQHVIGHHVYTNVGNRDPDLSHAPDLMRIHPSVALKPTHKNQIWNIPFVWTMAVPLGINFNSDIGGIINKKYNRIVKYMKLCWRYYLIHILGRLIYFSTYIYPFFVFELPQAFLFSLYPPLMFSVLFMICSQINHLSEDTMLNDDNFYKHQAMTSNTINPESLLVFFFTGGLNIQTEHHLFPGINHWHLRKIQPLVRNICIKHNIQYHEIPTMWDALKNHINYVKLMSHS